MKSNYALLLMVMSCLVLHVKAQPTTTTIQNISTNSNGVILVRSEVVVLWVLRVVRAGRMNITLVQPVVALENYRWRIRSGHPLPMDKFQVHP